MKNLLKTLLVGVALMIGVPIKSHAIIGSAVLITSSTLQNGTTMGIYLSSGTIKNFSASTETITNAVITGTFGGAFTANSTATWTGSQTFKSATCSSCTISTLSVSGPFNVTGATINIAGSSLTANNLSFLFSYRRPNLVWINATTMALSTNSSVFNQRSILFPDGVIRSSTEDVSTTQLYNAVKSSNQGYWESSSTVQSGIWNSTGVLNTSYEFYAVKVTSTGLTDRFVIIGSTVFPIQSNVASLNSMFSANGWIPIGLWRHGSSDGTFNAFLKGAQGSDGTTIFVSSAPGSSGGRPTGYVSTTTVSGGASLIFFSTTVIGAGQYQVPPNVDRVCYSFNIGSTASAETVQDSAGVVVYMQDAGLGAGRFGDIVWNGLNDGLQLTWTTATAATIDICGWHEVNLSGGPNPQW